jgi:peptidoglycan/xylan/chitin deacetylase (PgdA/CDA1 family)
MDYGHTIGNHTYTHSGTNSVSAKDYIKDIILSDSILTIIKNAYKNKLIPKLGVDIHQKILFDFNSNLDKYIEKQSQNHETIYFRYPFLQRGNSRAKRDSIATFLKTTNHIIAPVTITSHDWGFANEFYEAYVNSNQEEMDRISNDYFENVIEEINDSHNHSRREIGLSINHVFLMHMNLLNVYTFERILKWFKENGWEFITLKEAVKDRFYSWDDSYFGIIGIPWLYRAKKLMTPFPF